MKSALSFTIGAALAGSFGSAFSSAESRMAKMGDAMQHLNTQASRMDTFKAAEAGERNARKAWMAAQQQFQALKRELESTSAPTDKMRAAVSRAWKASQEARSSYLAQKQGLAALRDELGKAGITTANFAAEQKKMGAAIEATMHKMAAQNKMAALRQQRGQMIGDALAAAVVPGAVIASMKQAVGVAGDFEHALMRFGNTAGMSKDQVEAVRERILALSHTTNQSASDMLVGLSTLVGQGLDARQALASMEALGKAATATGGSVEDLAKTAFALQKSLNIAPEGLAKAIDSLAQSGKSGGFELKDMAKHLPELTAAAKRLHMEGAQGVASLGAALQIAFVGTGNADTAANNLSNFLTKVTAPETLKNFEKMHVNLEEELTNAMRSGTDPILFMIERINELVNGNEFKLGELFGDMQVQQFILPMLQNLKDFKKIKADALSADGVVNNDFQRAAETFNERVKGMGIAMSNFGEAMGRIFLPPLGWAAEKIGAVVQGVTWMVNTFPNATAVVIGAAMAFTSYRAAVLAAGVAQKTMEIIGIQTALVGGNVRSLGDAIALMKSGFAPFRSAIASTNAAMSAWLVESARETWTGIKAMPGSVVEAAKATWGYTKALGAAAATQMSAFGSAMWTGLKAAPGWLGNATVAVWNHTSAMALNAATSFTTVAGWRRMGAALSGAFVSGLQAATMGVRALGMAMIANPIGFVAAGIAAGAFLIYKYWEPISGWFQGVWQGITEAVKPVAPAFEQIGAAMAPLFAPVQWLWDAFTGLLQPVQDVDGAAQAMGKNVGLVIGGVIKDIAEMLGAVMKVIGTVVGAAASVANWVFGGDQKQAPPKIGDAMPKAVNDNKPVPAMGAAIKTTPMGTAVKAAPMGAAMAPQGSTPSASAQPATAAAPAGNVVPLRAPPPVASSAVSTASPPATINMPTTIVVHATPGMDEKAIAKQVQIALREEMRAFEARRRAANHD